MTIHSNTYLYMNVPIHKYVSMQIYIQIQYWYVTVYVQIKLNAHVYCLYCCMYILIRILQDYVFFITPPQFYRGKLSRFNT